MTGGHEWWMLAMVVAGMLALRLGITRTDPGTPRDGSPHLVALIAACCTIVVAFACELRTIDIAALSQQPMPAWLARLPIVPIDENPPIFGHTPPDVGNALIALAALQTLALYALYRLLRGRSVGAIGAAIIGLACATMLLMALGTRGTAATSDLYLNVGYGHLGLASYDPPAGRFPGEFDAVNRLWGTPILPSAYGPLWLLVAAAVVKTSSSLGGQLEALRLAGALAFAACIGLLRLAKIPAAAIAPFALNPALIFQFVTDGHNDVVPLALALAAIVGVARTPWVALVAVVCAGAMKLPFAVAGALAFARLERRRDRVLFTLAAGAGAAALTAVGSGGRYIGAVAHSLAYQRLTNPLDRLGHALAIGAALTALAAAVWRQRFIPGAAWSFLSFGSVVLPWYAAWAVPYAALEGALFPAFLITLPLLAFDLSTSFGITPAARILYVLVVSSPLALVLSRRNSFFRDGVQRR